MDKDNSETNDFNESTLKKIFHTTNKFAKFNPALFIFITTAVVTIVSFLINVSLYTYKFGYNFFFDIPNSYIKIQENFYYDLSLYVSVGIILLFFNYIAYICLKKGWKSRVIYFLVFSVIAWTILFLITKDKNISYSEHLKYNGLLISMLYMIISVLFHILTLITYVNNKQKADTLRSKIFKFLKEKLDMKISNLKNWLNTKFKNQSYTPKNIEKKNEGNKANNKNFPINKQRSLHNKIFFIVFIALIFSLYLLLFGILGHSNASNANYIKVISGKDLNVKIDNAKYKPNEYNDYAILFENDSIYLISPCKEKEKNKLDIISRVQIEINKKDIVTIGKQYNRITISENSTNNSDIEKELTELVNIKRENIGLKPLTLDTDLSRIALIKSQDMADKNYFDHNSPTYGSLFDMLSKLGANYQSASENISMGQKTSQEVMNTWMNSSEYRSNILSPKFKKIGIGYVIKDGTAYWTQIFTN